MIPPDATAAGLTILLEKQIKIDTALRKHLHYVVTSLSGTTRAQLVHALLLPDYSWRYGASAWANAAKIVRATAGRGNCSIISFPPSYALPASDDFDYFADFSDSLGCFSLASVAHLLWFRDNDDAEKSNVDAWLKIVNRCIHLRGLQIDATLTAGDVNRLAQILELGMIMNGKGLTELILGPDTLSSVLLTRLPACTPNLRYLAIDDATYNLRSDDEESDDDAEDDDDVAEFGKLIDLTFLSGLPQLETLHLWARSGFVYSGSGDISIWKACPKLSRVAVDEALLSPTFFAHLAHVVATCVTGDQKEAGCELLHRRVINVKHIARRPRVSCVGTAAS